MGKLRILYTEFSKKREYLPKIFLYWHICKLILDKKEKIRLESERELKKVQLELEKQAELYSKNAKTDAMSEFMGQFMAQFFTNPQGMEEQLKALERLGNIGKGMQG